MRRPLAALASLVLASAAQAQQAPADTTLPASRLFLLPYVGSAPETGFQYGLSLLHVTEPRTPGQRPSTAQLFGTLTTKNQARVFLEVDRWTRGNDWRLNARVEWQRFPLPYFGIGDTTSNRAREGYTPRGVLAFATVQRRLAGPLYAVGSYRWQDLDIIRTASGGLLARGTVPGSGGGRVAQLQGGALWDDRDDVFTPYRGSFVQTTASVADGALGSAFDFTRFVADARHYIPVGARRVLALQGVLETTGGTGAPFDQLSLVGSAGQFRGYERGRYRDRALLFAQAEYRAPLVRRWSWAAFAGGGTVAPAVGDLLTDREFLPSVGLGVRRQIFDRSRGSVRIDYAVGRDGQTGLYVALHEAF